MYISKFQLSLEYCILQNRDIENGFVKILERVTEVLNNNKVHSSHNKLTHPGENNLKSNYAKPDPGVWWIEFESRENVADDILENDEDWMLASQDPQQGQYFSIILFKIKDVILFIGIFSFIYYPV